MIYVVIRRTADWGNEAVFRAQIPEGFRPAAELWNTTFAMPYHCFRRELKRIAQRSVSRLDGATCVRREEIPDDAVVVSTDDDDWFSPRLVEVLEANLDGCHVGYHWPSKFIEVPINWRHQLGRIRARSFLAPCRSGSARRTTTPS